MSLPQEGQLLRIFIGETDRWHGRPLYQAIVQEAKRLGLAGATVFKGSEGFGASSRIQAVHLLQPPENPPVVIEIVDTVEKIQAFLVILSGMVKEGLVTVEKATIIFYRVGEEN